MYNLLSRVDYGEPLGLLREFGVLRLLLAPSALSTLSKVPLVLRPAKDPDLPEHFSWQVLFP